MDFVDDSHGYCKASLPADGFPSRSQDFKPVLITKYQSSTPFDGSFSHLEYFYLNNEFDKVASLGVRLLEESQLKYSLRRELFELLIRTNVKLGNNETALKYLAKLLDEFKSEDPGRDYLKIKTFAALEMCGEAHKACDEYLKIRPGDLNVIRLLIKNANAVGVDCEKWLKIEDQVAKCYRRGRP